MLKNDANADATVDIDTKCEWIFSRTSVRDM